MAASKSTTTLSFLAVQFGTGIVYLAPAGASIDRSQRIHVAELLKRRDLLGRLPAAGVERVKAIASQPHAQRS